MSTFKTSEYRQAPSDDDDTGKGMWPSGANSPMPTPSSQGEARSVSSTLLEGPHKRRIGWTLLVPTVLVVLATAGLGTLLFLWLFLHMYTPGSLSFFGRLLYVWQEGAFIVDEGSDGNEAHFYGLLISAVTSHLISTAAPVLIGLLAYRVAVGWLRHEAIRASVDEMRSWEQTTLVNADSRLISTVEYGILFSLLGSSSLYTLAKLTPSLWRNRRMVLASRSLVTSALWSFAVVFCLTHLIGVLDLWLHSGTIGTTVQVCSPLTNSSDYSFAFNPLSTTDGIPPTYEQATFVAGNFSQEYDQQHNTTSPFIQTLADDDNLAIAVPTTYPLETRFNASTLGARFQCRSLNSQCSQIPPSVLGPKASLVESCSTAGFSQLPYSDGCQCGQDTPLSQDSLVFNWIDIPNANDADAYDVVVQLVGPFYDPSKDDSTPADGTNWYDPNNSVLYAACNWSFYNVTVHYENARFAVVDSALMVHVGNTSDGISWNIEYSVSNAVGLESLFNYPIAPYLVQSVGRFTMSNSGVDGIMSVMSAELSRQALARIATVYWEPAETLDEELIVSKTMSRYPLPPLIALWISLDLYALLAIGATVWTIIGSRSEVVQLNTIQSLSTTKHGATALELAQLRLTNPLTVIADAFPSDDAQVAAELDAVRLFGADGMERRLAVGKYDSITGERFGVHRVYGFEEMKIKEDLSNLHVE